MVEERSTGAAPARRLGGSTPPPPPASAAAAGWRGAALREQTPAAPAPRACPHAPGAPRASAPACPHRAGPRRAPRELADPVVCPGTSQAFGIHPGKLRRELGVDAGVSHLRVPAFKVVRDVLVLRRKAQQLLLLQLQVGRMRKGERAGHELLEAAFSLTPDEVFEYRPPCQPYDLTAGPAGPFQPARPGRAGGSLLGTWMHPRAGRCRHGQTWTAHRDGAVH
eukprot:gene924-biopygen3198